MIFTTTREAYLGALHHLRWSFFVILTNRFKLLTIVIRNSISDVSRVPNPPLYMELTYKNFIHSYKVQTFILEKINGYRA